RSVSFPLVRVNAVVGMAARLPGSRDTECEAGRANLAPQRVGRSNARNRASLRLQAAGRQRQSGDEEIQSHRVHEASWLIGFAAPRASPRRVPTHRPSADRATPPANAPAT